MKSFESGGRRIRKQYYEDAHKPKRKEASGGTKRRNRGELFRKEATIVRRVTSQSLGCGKAS